MTTKFAVKKSAADYTEDELRNLSKDELLKLMSELQTHQDANLGIIRTRQGALMVRVSDERWPIAMYRRDWEILLSKVPYIKAALDELDIPDSNPNPKAKTPVAA